MLLNDDSSFAKRPKMEARKTHMKTITNNKLTMRKATPITNKPTMRKATSISNKTTSITNIISSVNNKATSTTSKVTSSHLRAASVILVIALLFVVLVPMKAYAADDFLSRLPFENAVIGNTKYNDCTGKPTIVVFGRITCGNTTTVLPLIDQLITENSLQNNLNLLFFDIDQPVNDIKAFFKKNALPNVAAFNGGNSIMWDIIRRSNPNFSSVTLPTVAYFTRDGVMSTVTTGYSHLNDIIHATINILGREYDFTSLPAMAAYRSNEKIYSAGSTDRAAQIYYRDANPDEITDAVRAKAKEITANIEGDYEKILAIHDWVAQNIYYDRDDYYKRTTGNKYDAPTVLSTRKSVCEGYASLTAALLRAVAIPVKTVYGYALGTGAKKPIMEGERNHAWTEAFADGRWIILDTTWDSNNEWEYGKISVSNGLIEGRPYFDPDLIDFSLDHRIDIYSPAAERIPTPSGWAASVVARANVLSLVPDTLNKAYQRNITRVEFCALAVTLYETINGTITGRASFSDTTDVNVEKMAAIGVVNGTGDGKFTPNGMLTREQAATILARLAEALGSPLPPIAASFADNSAIAPWAITAVGQVQAAGIMNGTGDNRFSPKGRYTHEQSIATVLRIWDAIEIGRTQHTVSGAQQEIA